MPAAANSTAIGVVETNFVADVVNIEPVDWTERGKGNATIFFEMSESMMGSHVSRFPVGIYKKAHRHGPGAHVFILTGKGYSLLWPEGKEMTRVDWKPGSIVVPPEGWFHQHFNSGAEPSRYLALKILSRKYKLAAGQDSIRRAAGLRRLADRVRGRRSDHPQDLRRGVRQIGRRGAHAAGCRGPAN